MDLKIKERELCTSELLLDTFDEKPVDYDFVLPEYCPEMAAVLKCTLCPVVSGSQWNGDRLIADGQVWIRVLYLDETRTCVRSYEYGQPFTSAFTVADRTPQTAVRLSVKADYVNCRATGPRRLDVHGSFRVRAQIFGGATRPILCEVEDETIYTQRAPICCSVPVASAVKPFTVNETLDSERGGDVGTVVRCEVVPTISDCKTLLGKLIVKGELLVKTLYIGDAESGRMERMLHELPFSQMVDIEGLNDEWTVVPEVRLTANDVRPTDNEEENGRVLMLSAKLIVCVQCWKTETAEVVTDAYSTRFPLHMEHTSLTTRRVLGMRRQTEVVKQSMDLPSEEITGVPDVHCEATVLDTRVEDGRRILEGRLTVGMLASDAEGQIGYYERPLDFTLDMAAEGTEETVTAEVTRTDYTVSAERKLELRVELYIQRLPSEVCELSTVRAMNGDESACFTPEKAALKVIFAQEGESLWGIARDCHTSVDAVMQENDLTADVLTQDTMLLVPTC